MWIAVNTHANAEDLAFANIERQGFECYCPKVMTVRRHARKTTTVLRPFFPGYLFVRIDPACDQWRPIVFSRGVRAVVMFSDRLSPVPDEFVAGLKSLENAGELKMPASRQRFRSGQKVRCYGTAFHNVIGQIIKVDEKDRIWTLMEILGRKVRVRMPSKRVVEA